MVSIIVCGFAKPFSNEVAAVKILNVDPNSYNPCAALLNNGLSEGSPEIATLGLLFGSKSGNETKEIISPVFTSINIAEAPFAFIKRIPFFKTWRVAA